MQIEPGISFQDLPASPEIEAEILKHVDQLEKFYDRIVSCRVVLSSPHRHRRHGRLYNVRIDLTVPDAEILPPLEEAQASDAPGEQKSGQ